MNGLRQRWSDLMVTECPDCGATVPVFAVSCGRCGSPNRARRAGIAIASALAFLLIAAGVAAFVVAGGRQLSKTTLEQPDARSTAASDFGWLEAAMKACDEEASKEPAALYFMVIPLASPAGEMAAWQAKSLNDIGNAILLSSDDALEGLRKATLQISPQEYVFSARDEATGAIYKWNRATGVAKVSTADADKIASFKIQFQTLAGTREDNWGNVFVRQAGTCYWVNAILGK